MSFDSDQQSCQQDTSIENLIDQDHVEQMINCQTEIISKLDKTNETLVNCNAIAKAKLATLSKTFKKSTQQIIDIKKDVEAIHKKVRNLKAKVIAEYPESVQNINKNVIDE